MRTNKTTMYRGQSLRQDLSWLWRQTEGCRLRIWLIMVYGILSALLGLGVVWLTRYLIDYASSLSFQHKTTTFSTTSLLILSGLLIAAFFLRTVLTTHSAQLVTCSEITIRNQLRGKLFSRLTRSNYLTLIRLHTGETVGRLDTDLPTVTAAMAEAIPSILVASLSFIGALVYLFLLSPTLCIIILIISHMFLVLGRRRIQSLHGLTGSIRRTASKINTYIQDSLRNILVIKSFQAETQATSTLELLQGQLNREIMEKDRMTTGSSAIVKLSFATAYLTAFIWGIWGLANGEISFGTLAAFLQLAGMIQRPLRRLGGSISGLAKVWVAIGRVRELEEFPLEDGETLSEEEEMRRQPLEEPMSDKGSVESSRTPPSLGVMIEGINYRYPDSCSSLFDNFSADFPPGSMTAVMGMTGSGKSTLLKLISTILLPVSGKIYLYTEDQSTVSPMSLSLRDEICYVPQDNSLLPGSIRANLLIGNTKTSDDEIKRALRVTMADEFVNKLPDGLDTVIGESMLLSEGQAQRLAIARALLRHGSILLLDEPTAALDSPVEARLVEQLKYYARNRTLIIVTHRHEVARLCDRVIVIDRD